MFVYPHSGLVKLYLWNDLLPIEYLPLQFHKVSLYVSFLVLSHLLNQKSGIVKFLLLHEAKDLNESNIVSS